MAVEDEIRGGAVIEPKTRIYPDQVCEDIFFFVIVESVQMPVPLLLHSFLLTFASSFLTPVPPATVMIFFFFWSAVSLPLWFLRSFLLQVRVTDYSLVLM